MTQNSLTNDLEPWRNRIDEIEVELLKLLNERAQCAVKIGQIKKELGLEIFDPKREDIILKRVAERNSGPFSDQSIQNIILTIMAETRALEAENHPL
jgi:chorismate mutase-like protein